MNAIKDIDKRLGDGYAEQHPELIGAYMKAASIDLAGAVMAGAIEDLSETVESLSEIAAASESIAEQIGELARPPRRARLATVTLPDNTKFDPRFPGRSEAAFFICLIFFGAANAWPNGRPLCQCVKSEAAPDRGPLQNGSTRKRWLVSQTWSSKAG
jgi:hypothetical protein